MNKEQKKPQEECSCECHIYIYRDPSKEFAHCINCQKPQEDWEIEFNEKFGTGNLISECPHGWDTEKAKDIKDHIRSNFIAKRDLRKLLKEIPCKLEHHDSYPDECCHGETIDDILAELKI